MRLTVEVYCDIDHAERVDLDPAQRWRVVFWEQDEFGYADTSGLLGDPYHGRHFERDLAVRLAVRLAARLERKVESVTTLVEPEPSCYPSCGPSDTEEAWSRRAAYSVRL